MIEVEPDRVALAKRIVAESTVLESDAATFDVVATFIAEAFDHGRRHALAKRRGIRVCRVCGCSELDACEPCSCWWIEDEDLCSVCAPYVEAAP